MKSRALDITPEMKPLIEVMELLQDHWDLYDQGKIEANSDQVIKIENAIDTIFNLIFNEL